MSKQTMGAMIAALRKEHNMTQLDLAQKMGVTDKAVSKWERDLAFPDVSTLPKLAEVLGVSVDELIQCKKNQEKATEAPKGNLVSLICKAVALAMGVAGLVLSILKQLDLYSAIGMMSIAIIAIAIYLFTNEK